jgi:energy-coupling factor transporter ATP-binding protein EcfA2
MKATNEVVESRLDFIRAGKGGSSYDGLALPQRSLGKHKHLLHGGDLASDAEGFADGAGLDAGDELEFDEEVEATLELQPVLAAPPVERGPEYRPRSIRELGIRRSIVEDLAVKALYLGGTMTVLELARHTRLSFDVGNELLERLRAEKLCEVMGMKGSVPEIAITTHGRARAAELMARSQYTGAAPVSLKSYVTQVRKQSVRNVTVRRQDVTEAFGHMAMGERTLTQIGTALNSGASIFIYGPPGTGKTSIAETMCRVLAKEDVWIPYAVEVDGQTIAVYDPAIHHTSELVETSSTDERWVRCRRPAVMVGGELTIDMLDLQYNAATHYYTGPVQMKANNGVLIIDDFGRQRVRPEELLNRWVVPLERRTDFLTLAGGRKIEIPFEMLVVFATNMEPADLVDAAFLRRMQTKIRIDAATDEQFQNIFRKVASDRGMTVEAGVVAEVIGFIRGEVKEELRGCQPRDLVNQVLWAARYEDREPALDRASLMAAAGAYFLKV